MPLATLLGVERLTLSTSNQTPGAQSITVPAGTQGVVVMSRANSAGLTLSSSFAGTWTAIAPSSGVEWLQYAPVTATGAQTLTPVWSAFLSEGPVFYIFYVGNIDNSSPAAWVRATSSGEVDSTSVASTADDLVIALDTCSSATGTFPGAASGWTTQGTPYNNGNVGARARTADSPGASTTSVTRVLATGTDFHGLSVISIIGLAPSFATGTGPRLTSDLGGGPLAGGPSGEYLRGTSAGGPTIVTASQALAWSVRNLATGSRALVWSVRNLITGSRSLAWSVRNSAASSQSIAWSVRNSVTASQGLAWSVRNYATGSQASAWSVRGYVSASQDLAWSVESAVVIVTSSQSIAWSVRNSVSATRSLAWSVRNLASTTQPIAWSVRNTASATRSLSWRVFNYASANRPAAWSVRGYAAGSQSIAWSVESDVIPEPNGWLVPVIRRRRR